MQQVYNLLYADSRKPRECHRRQQQPAQQRPRRYKWNNVNRTLVLTTRSIEPPPEPEVKVQALPCETWSELRAVLEQAQQRGDVDQVQRCRRLWQSTTGHGIRQQLNDAGLSSPEQSAAVIVSQLWADLRLGVMNGEAPST